MINKNILYSFVLILISIINYRTYAQERPNIIVFLVDDMGWVDTSLPFGENVEALNKVYHTPNMERMAKNGMLFSDAYATPVCTPSRVSMLTGMNAAHHQVTNWTSIVRDQPSDRDDDKFERLEWNHNGYSPTSNISNTVHATALPQILRDAGYFTIHVGKAHWGSQGTPGANPLNLGFIINVAGNSIGHPQSYLGKDNYGNVPGKFTYNAVQGLAEYYGTETFLTEALTQEAMKTLEEPRKQGQPFYLHLAHYAVHDPIQADERFVQKYYDRNMDSIEARYASLVEGMDKSLGDILDYLEEHNLVDNTVVLFMSDNGGLSHYGRGGERHTQNLPLKAGKGSVYEGGVREPMLVQWRGKVKAGTRSDQPVIIEDFFPSILELAGITDPQYTQQIDGCSFVPVLEGKETNRQGPLIWHYPHRWTVEDGPGINFFSAIREGNWKLVYDHKEEALELYNLKNDIGEHKNLLNEQNEITKKLAGQLTEHLKKWNAKMPVYKETGKAIPWPDEILNSQKE
ncbi:MAG TPA: sulfatase [Sphingobacterium sp.]|nr:sulfatase [Sphingobacterium sp.]